MIIEKLNISDIKLYKDLLDDVFGETNDIEEYSNYNYNDSYEIIVAKQDNLIVGAIGFYKIDLFMFSNMPSLELFGIALKKEYRGMNIAEDLFNYIKKYALENSYKSIYVSCFEEAYGAHKFYEKMGMKRTTNVKFVLDLSDNNE